MDYTYKHYTITWKPIKPESPRLQRIFKDELYWEILNPERKTVKKLLQLIKQYPNNPQLKNHLAIVYQKLGDHNKAMKINQEIIEEFPDYFFAKVNAATQYIHEQQFEKIPKLLGKDFDLNALYPDRVVFHGSEFLNMQYIAISYYIGVGKLKEAEDRLRLMEEVGEDSDLFIRAKIKITDAQFQKAQNQFLENEKGQTIPKTTFKLDKNIELPALQLPETSKLFEEEVLTDQMIDMFLSLDKKQLIADLETILKKSIYFHKEGTPDFEVLHAIFLLDALEATESLPIILEMMCKDQDYLDDVFGDLFSVYGWVPLMNLVKNQLPLAEDYLKLPGLNLYFKSTMLEALTQIYCHYPNKQDELIKIFESLLEFYTQLTTLEEIIDADLNAFFIWYLTDLKQEQLLPQIKVLYEKGYVSEMICGSFEEVEESMIKSDTFQLPKNTILTIKEFYQILA